MDYTYPVRNPTIFNIAILQRNFFVYKKFLRIAPKDGKVLYKNGSNNKKDETHCSVSKTWRSRGVAVNMPQKVLERQTVMIQLINKAPKVG